MTKEIKVVETTIHKYTQRMNVVGKKDEMRIRDREVTVAKGKLFLIDVSAGKVQIEAIQNKVDGTIFIVGRGWVKPIILSETEKPQLNELMYHPDKGFKVGDIWNNFPDIIEAKSHWFPDMPKDKAFIHGFRKVLVLPTMFSKDDLSSIEKGKLKDGAKVLVRTEKVYQNSSMSEAVLALLPSQWNDTVKTWQRVKLNPHGRATLFQILAQDKVYSLQDVLNALDAGIMIGFKHTSGVANFKEDAAALAKQQWIEKNLI